MSGWGSGGASPPEPRSGPGAVAAPRLLLRRLREALAAPDQSGGRLGQIVELIARSMAAEVCSVYLLRGSDTLELRATQGLNPDSINRAKLGMGEGLVGVIARDAHPVITADAHAHPEFRYLPETGEERYSSFLGVPIQKTGKMLGVLVIQNERAIRYSEEDSEALALVAMVIAEMTEAGTLLPEAEQAATNEPFHLIGQGAADGVAIGPAYLHEPRLLLPNPIADDVLEERDRLRKAGDELRSDIEAMLAEDDGTSGEHREILETYRLYANDKHWFRKLEEAVLSGLTAEAAVDAARTETRAKLDRLKNPVMRDRLNDLDDIAKRLLRRLLGPSEAQEGAKRGSILVARGIGPGELLDYPRETLAGIVLEDGAVASHATIVARALDIPLIVQARGITREVETGQMMIANGEQGHVHVRPRPDVVSVYEEKLALRTQARMAYEALRDQPALTSDGAKVELMINAGLSADLPSLTESGAEGVGLLRTELHFMLNSSMPTREDQSNFYSHILDKAEGRPVTFRTLDIGSDKVLPYFKQPHEENPALGWRAIRIALDRPVILKMQAQALLRASKGRPLRVMFPMVADCMEFMRARDLFLEEVERVDLPINEIGSIHIGAMLETPSLAFARDTFFDEADFISIGGNDLLQFFFAADRGNEKTAGRYNALNPAFMGLMQHIVRRCAEHDTPLSFCGESAGKPLQALGLIAAGLRTLSMRPAAIGPVKRAIRGASLEEVQHVLDACVARGGDPHEAMLTYCRETGIPV